MKESQSLSDLTTTIHNLFGLQKQGKALVAFVANTMGCKRACLLFLNVDEEDFFVLAYIPKSKTNHFINMRLNLHNPIVSYLRRKKTLITRDILTTLPDFTMLDVQKTVVMSLDKVALLIPVISRKRLIGILVLGDKNSNEYSTEDYSWLQSVTNQVAVGMEKEYLREQLEQQKETLSVINRSSTIMASSLDIQRIFDSFIKELKKIVDIDWAAINLIGDDELWLLALFSEVGSAWHVGERIPIKGTATEWLMKHKRTLVESDISRESRFVTAALQLKQGIRSIAYLPLTTKSKTLGSLIIASCKPDAYDSRQIGLLEELTSQIIMPIENSQLYAEVAAKARIDGLTGLFNRRSFDEMIESETSRYSRYGGTFSLIIADLDSLKYINDTYGHLAGDEVLRQIADVIRKAIRTSDRAFRYGGDEFAILLPSTSVDAANIVTERIRKQVASKTIGNQTPFTVSLGLASWPNNGKDANAVIAAADAALYKAKRSGGNNAQRATTTNN